MIFFYIKIKGNSIFSFIIKKRPKTQQTEDPMTDFLMKPKIDFAFKEIMEDAKARTGFLAAVLHLKPDDIRETRILNSHLRKAHKEDKKCMQISWKKRGGRHMMC